ncbi:MAG: alpha/beta hydrolase [Gemmataceae bacterium]|nr:alpha/beta hydrolase [Gemmataceae bacterium]
MKSRYAHVNGIRLHYLEVGEGPLVVLLHGFPEFSYSWRHQLPALAAAGFRAIAPDLRGYNLSDKPPDVSAYGIEPLTRDIVGLIRHVGAARAVIVGHDWGGGIAWNLTLRHPELVERLVILNSPHPALFFRELRTLRQLRKSWYMFYFQLPWLPEWGWRRHDYALLEHSLRESARPDTFTDEDVRRYKEAMARPGALTAALNYYRAVFRTNPRRVTRNIRPIETPTLVLWGEADRYLGTSLLDGLEHWVPNVRIERLPGVSHWVQNEAPQRVNELMIEFLKETSKD